MTYNVLPTLFPAPNSYNYIPGTYIYHKHLNSVDKDERICSKDEYVSPKKVIATKFELVP